MYNTCRVEISLVYLVLSYGSCAPPTILNVTKHSFHCRGFDSTYARVELVRSCAVGAVVSQGLK